jgi:hypothetical protein
MNAVDLGNKVVVLKNDEVTSSAWDPKKNRVDNGSAYVAPFWKTRPMAST